MLHRLALSASRRLVDVSSRRGAGAWITLVAIVVCGCERQPAGPRILRRGEVPELGVTYTVDLEGLQPRPGEEATLMELDAFWTLIDGARGATREVTLARTRRALAALGVEGVRKFAARFEALHDAAYREDLWSAAELMRHGCSDDSFIDFRAWLISKGRATYEAALADPDSLADVAEEDHDPYCFEEFGNLAMEVHFGLAAEEGDPYLPAALESTLDPSAELSEEERRARLPRLRARFDR